MKRALARMAGLAAIGGALGLAACTSSDGLPGAVLAKGLGRNVAVSQGGGAVAFLLDAAHPDDRTVPEDLVAGDLWLGSLRGAPVPAARKVGAAVPSIAGAIAFAPQQEAIAFLSSWRFRTGEGELWAGLPGREPKKLAEVASSFGWAPVAGALAWVSRGRLVVQERPLEEGGRQHGLEGIQTFTWAPDGKMLAARAPAGAGGKLFLLELATGTWRELAPSTDVGFAVDGALAWLGPAGPKGGDRVLSILEPGAKAARELGRATAFAFSPDGKRLGLLSTERSPGDAFGELSLLSRAGGAAQPVGQKVSEWHFTTRGELLLLSGYDLRSRAGTLVYAAPGSAPKEVSKRVQSFQASPQGDRVLYLAHKVEKTDFKLELWLESLPVAGAPLAEPRRIDEGVYGFQLSPDNVNLFWKARCGGLRTCVLFRAPLDGLLAPVMVEKEVAGFELSDDGKRLLVAHPHPRAARAVDSVLLDALAPPKDSPARPFALEVDPGARFADTKGARLVAAKLSAHEPRVVAVDLP